MDYKKMTNEDDTARTTKQSDKSRRVEASAKPSTAILPKDFSKKLDLLVAICLVVGSAVGISSGLQAMYSGAKARGVFSDKCTTEEISAVLVNGTSGDDVWCKAQDDAVAGVADACFSFLNAISAVDGILVDAVGGRIGIMLFTGLWTLSAALSGFAFSSGYLWGACSLGMIWGIEGVLLSILVYHLKVICHEGIVPYSSDDADRNRIGEDARSTAAAPSSSSNSVVEDDHQKHQEEKNADSLYKFWCGGITSLWDLGTFTSIPIGYYWIGEGDAVPIQLCYFLIAVVFGIPMLLWVTLFSRRYKNQKHVKDGLTLLDLEENSGNTTTGGSTNNPSDDQQEMLSSSDLPVGTAQDLSTSATSTTRRDDSEKHSGASSSKLSMNQSFVLTLKITKNVLVKVVQDMRFWITTLQAITTVTFSAFFIATLGVIMQSQYNADDDETSNGRVIFAYMRGFGGFLYFLPSRLTQTFGLKQGMMITQGFLGILVCLLPILLFSRSPSQGFSLPFLILFFFVFLLWRAFSFSALNTLLLIIFNDDYGHNVAFLYGFIYSIGGLLSLGIGGVATNAAVHSSTAFVTFFAVLSVASALVHGLIVFFLAKKYRPPKDINF